MDDEFEKAMNDIEKRSAPRPGNPDVGYSCNLENPEICESCQ